MSRKVVRLVDEHSRSRLSSRRVLEFFASRAHEVDGVSDGVSWWGEEKTCAELGISERAFRDCIKRLKALDEVEVVQAHREKSTVRFNVYRVTLPGVDDVDYERIASAGVILSRRFEDRNNDRQFSPGTTGSFRENDRQFPSGTTGSFRRSSRARDPLSGSNRKEDQSQREYVLAAQILERFNRIAETDFAEADWARLIAKRIREFPHLTLDDHFDVIEDALADDDPWWDYLDPRVVYEAKSFEVCLHKSFPDEEPT